MKKTLLLLSIGVSGAVHASGWEAHPFHTRALFEVDHFGATLNRGRFPVKEAKLEFDQAAKTGKVEILLDLAGVTTEVPAFTEHLKGPEFFDVTKNPTARFVSTRFVFAGDKLNEVSGMLTLNGRTLPISLRTTMFNCYQSPVYKREVCGGEFETMIKRGDYGIDYALKLGAPENVKLIVQMEAISK